MFKWVWTLLYREVNSLKWFNWATCPCLHYQHLYSLEGAKLGPTVWTSGREKPHSSGLRAFRVAVHIMYMYMYVILFLYDNDMSWLCTLRSWDAWTGGLQFSAALTCPVKVDGSENDSLFSISQQLKSAIACTGLVRDWCWRWCVGCDTGMLHRNAARSGLVPKG